MPEQGRGIFINSSSSLSHGMAVFLGDILRWLMMFPFVGAHKNTFIQRLSVLFRNPPAATTINHHGGRNSESICRHIHSWCGPVRHNHNNNHKHERQQRGWLTRVFQLLLLLLAVAKWVLQKAWKMYATKCENGRIRRNEIPSESLILETISMSLFTKSNKGTRVVDSVTGRLQEEERNVLQSTDCV